MPARVVNLKNSEDLRDVVHLAVEALSAGQIVAIPTETVYGVAASALNEQAVSRLLKIKHRTPGKPLAFAIKSLDDALDYVPDLSDLGRRLGRRCWPGPVTLVLEDKHPDSVISRLPETVRRATVARGTVGLRVPAHEATLQILRLLAGPIVLTSANISGEEALIDGADVIEHFGDEIDLILDDGRSHYGQASSVVKIIDNRYELLRAGVVGETVLNQMAGFIALVVCTGNTCRSPMGEALFKKHMANHLNCNVSELESLGITVASAGIAAMPGGQPSSQSVEVMSNMGLDITKCRSQPVTEQLIRSADVILTLTGNHRHAIVSRWPDAASRTHTLRTDGQDVTDPIGMPVDIYQACAEQIEQNVEEWIEKLAPQIDSMKKANGDDS
ncbi:MAG: threonylcarbamoyl-AMP synthase [Mariniblastus sp.]|nr:threonylcarbamoyl-AMP synthase [Mariniblastus sp.]